MTDQLFNPDDYPSSGDVERRPRNSAAVNAEPTPEPWVDPWVVISTRRGPIPYTHLPVDPERLEGLRSAGSLDRTALLTSCGEVGWPISRAAAGVYQMLPCPTCKESI